MTGPPLRIEIIGGGLAGLSLGLALRRNEVPVTVFEAGDYPRHRVCGEFITGLNDTTIEALGLASALAGARSHRRVAWFRDGRAFCEQELPTAAWAMSRHRLDARLAGEFVGAGGELRTRTRIEGSPCPGRVDATGRRRTASPWIGLKQHFRGLSLMRGLEMHLGCGSYAGLCELPDGTVNVCGLFRGPLRQHGGSPLNAALRACGLGEVARRTEAAEPVQYSFGAVAGFGFDQTGPPFQVRIGDAWSMLPPFLGNGMAAAFQASEQVLPVLLAWSRGAIDWNSVVRLADERLRARFRRRQRWGNAVHGFLLNEPGQRWFARLARAHCLPLTTLYQVLH